MKRIVVDFGVGLCSTSTVRLHDTTTQGKCRVIVTDYLAQRCIVTEFQSFRVTQAFSERGRDLTFHAVELCRPCPGSDRVVQCRFNHSVAFLPELPVLTVEYAFKSTFNCPLPRERAGSEVLEACC